MTPKVIITLTSAVLAAGTVTTAAVYQNNVEDVLNRHVGNAVVRDDDAPPTGKTYYFAEENENHRTYYMGVPEIDCLPWRCDVSMVQGRSFAQDESGEWVEVNRPDFDISLAAGFDFGEVPERYSFNVNRRCRAPEMPKAACYKLSPDGELLNGDELSYGAKLMYDEVQPELLTILDEVQTCFSLK